MGPKGFGLADSVDKTSRWMWNTPEFGQPITPPKVSRRGDGHRRGPSSVRFADNDLPIAAVIMEENEIGPIVACAEEPGPHHAHAIDRENEGTVEGGEPCCDPYESEESRADVDSSSEDDDEDNENDLKNDNHDDEPNDQTKEGDTTDEKGQDVVDSGLKPAFAFDLPLNGID